jgi:hypothetical protein
LRSVSRNDADRQTAAIVAKAAVAIGVKLPKERRSKQRRCVDASLIKSWRRNALPRGRRSDAPASRLADRKSRVQGEIARKILTSIQQNRYVDLDRIIQNVIHPDPREWPDWPDAQP